MGSDAHTRARPRQEDTVVSRIGRISLFVLGTLAATALEGRAQPLGTFRFQLQPYCNVVVLTITQDGGVYTLDGYDEQCGAPTRASAVGLAFPNPDGSIGLGFTMVTTPGGVALHVDAAIAAATGNGTWRDSGGNSGAIVLITGAGTGGSPRPVPAGGVAPGSITAAQLAPGAITAAQIAPGSLTAALFAPGAVQSAVTGVCRNGQALRGINVDGSVACTTVTTVVGTTSGPVAAALGRDGLPILAYHAASGSGLVVTHCGNDACTAGNVTTIVDATAGSGQHPAIVIGADGVAVISHSDGVSLRVTHCGTTDCSAGAATSVADAGAGVRGLHSAIAIGRDGLPVISHQIVNAGNVRALRVTHCGDPGCAPGGAVSTNVDTAPQAGRYSSIAIGSDGLPVISHSDAQVLRITHCNDAACTAATVATTAVAGGHVDNETSMAIGADGVPVISYYDSNAEDLWVLHCGDARCATGNVTTRVDGAGRSAGRESSLAVAADGRPRVAYYDDTAQALRLAACGNRECTTSASTFIDDPASGVVGQYPALIIPADGWPLVGYFDQNAGVVKAAKCGTAACQ